MLKQVQHDVPKQKSLRNMKALKNLLQSLLLGYHTLPVNSRATTRSVYSIYTNR